MKKMPSSKRFCSRSPFLLASFVLLVGACILLIGLATISKTFAAARIGSASAGSSIAALSTNNHPVSSSGPARRLDEQGNRPLRVSFLPLHPRNTRAIRPGGNGDWSSLGPPGGDVFDAAVSTVDSNMALAGLAPGGSFGGTLYRSSDGGNTWSEVPALDGTSVFDIEFAADGTVYLGTQDSVRKSTDGGASWATLNLGIGPNDQVF